MRAKWKNYYLFFLLIPLAVIAVISFVISLNGKKGENSQRSTTISTRIRAADISYSKTIQLLSPTPTPVVNPSVIPTQTYLPEEELSPTGTIPGETASPTGILSLPESGLYGNLLVFMAVGAGIVLFSFLF